MKKLWKIYENLSKFHLVATEHFYNFGHRFIPKKCKASHLKWQQSTFDLKCTVIRI